MGKPNFSDEFKRDAVAQITERGYPVAEVSQRLEEENVKLKRLLAEAMLDNAGLKDLLSKMYGPPPSGKHEMWLAAQSA